MSLKDRIIALSGEYHPEIVEIRRHIHQHPELSFQEYETSAYICQKLSSYGIEYKSGIAKTGIVGWIRGINPNNKIVALRADMDALPILEENDVAYQSVNRGTMHACGHDAHIASLLGTAKILAQIKHEFEGSVMLIFQPSEERLPGGAKTMMDEGIFDLEKPDVIIAQHVFPSLEAGYIGFRGGKYMASSDELYVTIKGRGGHGAIPQELTDTVLAASHIIVALQQIVSRNAEAAIPTVLSFGKVIANGSTNIIPNEVYMEGTFRTMDETWRVQAHEKMIKLAQSIADGMGVECIFDIKKGYPVLVNNEGITQKAKGWAQQFLGEEKVSDLDLRMTSEDFSYFTQRYPCTYYRLGIKKKGAPSYPLHSSRFDIDEDALKTGASFMAWLTIKLLSNS